MPPGAVEGHRQVRPQRLAQRMLAHQCAQLTDELGVAATGELGLDPAFQRVQPHLVEPESLRHEQSTLGDLRQGRPAPEGERLGERRRGFLRSPILERFDPVRRQLLEAIDVAAATLDAEHVRVASRLDRVAPEGTAQIGDVALHHVARGGRRGLAPHLIDQAAHRDRPIRADHEHAEHCTTARATQGDDTAAVAYLQRSENPVVAHAASAASVLRRPNGRPARRAVRWHL